MTTYRVDTTNLMIRDSVIHRFEFTFEIAQSLMRKFVSEYSVNIKDREQLTFPTLIRTASQDGVLLSGFDKWHSFREARNLTSHTYNEEQAVAVIAIVPEFAEEIRFLYTRLDEELSND